MADILAVIFLDQEVRDCGRHGTSGQMLGPMDVPLGIFSQSYGRHGTSR